MSPSPRCIQHEAAAAVRCRQCVRHFKVRRRVASLLTHAAGVTPCRSRYLGAGTARGAVSPRRPGRARLPSRRAGCCRRRTPGPTSTGPLMTVSASALCPHAACTVANHKLLRESCQFHVHPLHPLHVWNSRSTPNLEQHKQQGKVGQSFRDVGHHGRCAKRAICKAPQIGGGRAAGQGWHIRGRGWYDS